MAAAVAAADRLCPAEYEEVEKAEGKGDRMRASAPSSPALAIMPHRFIAGDRIRPIETRRDAFVAPPNLMTLIFGRRRRENITGRRRYLGLTTSSPRD